MMTTHRAFRYSLNRAGVALLLGTGLTPFAATSATNSATQTREAFDDYGPLKTYAQSPLQSNSLTPQVRSGFRLPTQTVELYGTGTIASVWANTDDYKMDYYQNDLSVGSYIQINEKWAIEMDYTWRFAANNGLDTLTKAFHDTFGIGLNGRDEVDKHAFDISVPQYGVEIHDFEGKTLSNAFTIYASYQVLENTHHGLSLGGSLYYNYVGSGPFKTSSLEQALQLNYSYRSGKHRVYTLLGLSYRHNDEVLSNIPYNHFAFSSGISYQYAIAPRHRLITEFHLYEGASDATSDLNEPSTEVLLGYRYHTDEGAIEISMIENVFNMDNSTDIAFTLGYRHRVTFE
ncbi:DUF3187 family protein [Photobacterium aphoticum]|uniref:DUF3187 family protein n=1 Tax=Photobacterium aphoticum TaxID=754436 RepID=UPI000AB0907B|nr:DUF3187 family protein [Photobacterium aphoticum]